MNFKQDHQGLLATILLFPLPYIAYAIWYHIHKRNLRNMPRISSAGKPMKKLTETEDDLFLAAGQIMEEELKSINYDVWVNEDRTEVKIEGYSNYLSKYSVCNKCKYTTNYVKSDITMQSPSYVSSGKGLKKYLCKNCRHEREVTYVIPRLERSDNTSSSSSDSGSSSSSFGGGSSGGGGAGGSW